MNPDETDLADMLISWTGMTVTWISIVIFMLGAIGLFLSLTSFINLFNSVKDSAEQGMMGNRESPLWHMIAIMVGALISVSGLVWGFASLFWSSAT